MSKQIKKMLAGVLIATLFLSSVISAPTPSPEPQFPFTVLPKKGESFRKPFKQPRGENFKIVFRKFFAKFYFRILLDS